MQVLLPYRIVGWSSQPPSELARRKRGVARIFSHGVRGWSGTGSSYAPQASGNLLVVPRLLQVGNPHHDYRTLLYTRPYRTKSKSKFCNRITLFNDDAREPWNRSQSSSSPRFQMKCLQVPRTSESTVRLPAAHRDSRYVYCCRVKANDLLPGGKSDPLRWVKPTSSLLLATPRPHAHAQSAGCAESSCPRIDFVPLGDPLVALSASFRCLLHE